MNQKTYIEHEVQIRVMKEVNDSKFKTLESTMKHMDSKINWILGIVVTSFVVPVALHALKLI